MGAFAFLWTVQIRGASCSTLPEQAAAARWLQQGEPYFTGQKLWVNVVRGSWGLPPEQLCIDHLCLQSVFFQSLSFPRALILMCFLWMAI